MSSLWRSTVSASWKDVFVNNKTWLAILSCAAIVGTIILGWRAIHQELTSLNNNVVRQASSTRDTLGDDFAKRCGESSDEVLEQLATCVAYANTQTDQLNKYQSLLTRNNQRLSTLATVMTSLNERAGEHTHEIQEITAALDDSVIKADRRHRYVS